MQTRILLTTITKDKFLNKYYKTFNKFLKKIFQKPFTLIKITKIIKIIKIKKKFKFKNLTIINKMIKKLMI